MSKLWQQINELANLRTLAEILENNRSKVGENVRSPLSVVNIIVYQPDDMSGKLVRGNGRKKK